MTEKILMTNRFTHIVHGDTNISNLDMVIERFKSAVRPSDAPFSSFAVLVDGEPLDALEVDIAKRTINFRSRS